MVREILDVKLQVDGAIILQLIGRPSEHIGCRDPRSNERLVDVQSEVT